MIKPLYQILEELEIRKENEIIELTILPPLQDEGIEHGEITIYEAKIVLENYARDYSKWHLVEVR